jgi:putative nucleotidyltransferase with HDIG domain
MPNDRILVVDDEETIREIVSSMLTGAQFQCRQAASGAQALSILESGEEFDLVLSDLMMAEMDGIALLEKSKERFPDVPVVMVTAVHDLSVALQALRNGAYDYLLKPFERDQLLAMVRRALEHRRLKRENDAYRTKLESLVEIRTRELKDALSDLKKSYNITLQAFGYSLELKDAETLGHTKRVTAYAIAIASKMGIPSEEIEVIGQGAWLHDIGKMAIPDGILKKPGKLTAEETAIMREHAYYGFDILSKIPFLAKAAEIVYAHQECYDGTGYPRQLKGDQIPLGARIFSIADTLDAMTSNRVYRPAQTYEAAQKEILRCSGTQFDPAIVEVFLEMPASFWLDLRESVNAANNISPTPAPPIRRTAAGGNPTN